MATKNVHTPLNNILKLWAAGPRIFCGSPLQQGIPLAISDKSLNPRSRKLNNDTSGYRFRIVGESGL
jgi:hypothetical protein